PSAVDQTPARTVTLLVTPKNAEAIELASSSGRPRLVLRGSTDHNPTGSVGMSFDELFGSDPKAAPAANPQSPTVADATTQPNQQLDQIMTAINGLRQPSTQPVQD